MPRLTAVLSALLMTAVLSGSGYAGDSKAKAKDEKAKAPAAEAKAPEAAPAAAPAPATAAEAAPAADAKNGPETILFDKTAKMAPVKFPHRKHQAKADCKTCHEGEPALFQQKKSEVGLKMSDMYAGKNCGSCHDGKKTFAAKGGCMKCHKK